MATPYDDLPLPSANEYPYNLQGDQTKARALAEAARSGNSSALDRLRTLGLDDRGNLAPYTPNLNANNQPQGTAPTAGGGSGARPGSAQDLSQARFNEQMARQKELDAENKRRWDQTNTQNQSKDSRDFAESQRRFNEQTALAKQRQNFQEQQAREKAAADKAAAAQKAQQAAQKGGGGKGQQPKAPKAPKGGGGGGGGKSFGGASPAQKARREARTERKRNDNKAAQAAGYGSARAQDEAMARRDFMDRGETSSMTPKTEKQLAQQEKNRQNQQKNMAAEKERMQNWKDQAEAKAREKAQAEAKAKADAAGTGENGTGTGIYGDDEEEGQKQAKMTHAYGNKYAGLVRARGDLA